jgi:hypothetical protein
MDRLFKTVVIPADLAPLMHALAGSDGRAALAMGWSAPCFDAAGVYTHYLFTGLISAGALAMLQSPQALQAAVAGIAELTLDEAAAVLGRIVVSDEESDSVLTGLGLHTEQPQEAA